MVRRNVEEVSILDQETESSNFQRPTKHLGVFEAGILFSILALFVPYGIEHYEIQMFEHIGTITYWFFSAPLWHTMSVESFFSLEFPYLLEFPRIWYLFLIRALPVMVLLYYYSNRIPLKKTKLLLALVFIIEFVMIIIPLQTVFVSIPTFSIPVPLFAILCFLSLHLMSPEKIPDTKREQQESMAQRKTILSVCIIIVLTFIIAPGFYVYWDTGLYISIRMHSIFPGSLFSEYFRIHHIYRFLFAAQVIRYYQSKTSLLRAILPGLVGMALTILLNIPSYIYGFETIFYWYSPVSYVLPVPILFFVGVFLMILKRSQYGLFSRFQRDDDLSELSHTLSPPSSIVTANKRACGIQIASSTLRINSFRQLLQSTIESGPMSLSL
ncbi:MAG: hypothetical protein RTV31_10500 [Candidatus Thorarchaeota archaeon]